MIRSSRLFLFNMLIGKETIREIDNLIEELKPFEADA